MGAAVWLFVTFLGGFALGMVFASWIGPDAKPGDGK